MTLSHSEHSSSSSLPFVILVFILIQVWALMAFETAQYQLLAAYEAPFSWFFWADVILLVLTPVATLLTWWAKRRVRVSSLDWEFRDREVVLDEFKTMSQTYSREYVGLVSVWDWKLVVVTIVAYASAVCVPFALIRTDYLGISISPLVFGVLTAVYALALIATLYRGLPGGMTDQFPVHSYRKVAQAVRMLSQTEGVSWCGVRMTIGESQGYFTIHDPRAVAHVEGIEGVARLESRVSPSADAGVVTAVLEEGAGLQENVGGPVSISDHLGRTLLVRDLLQLYISKRGENEMLDDVVKDVEDTIRRLKEESSRK
ncbi:MAG: hypothetical protein ACP6KW_00785 [Candidatus Thorarchaeota archaeon]